MTRKLLTLLIYGDIHPVRAPSHAAEAAAVAAAITMTTMPRPTTMMTMTTTPSADDDDDSADDDDDEAKECEDNGRRYGYGAHCDAGAGLQ